MPNTSIQHFLTLLDLSSSQLNTLINHAQQLKKIHQAGQTRETLKNKVLAMIFEKSSTRTRVSFESAMIQLGGGSIFLSPKDTQMSRGESTEDTAKVMSGMVDCVMFRTFSHDKCQVFAQNARVPVINALTNDYHPCQLLADIQTFFETRGNIQGAKVCWVGDGNNMCHSYINAAIQFNFDLTIICPESHQPRQDIVDYARLQGTNITITDQLMDGVKQSHLVVTDVWTSMGQEQETQDRLKTFGQYQVNEHVLDQADKDVIFMHCLPAHRGEEISDTLLEDPRSMVWIEAENRLHAQKALLELVTGVI